MLKWRKRKEFKIRSSEGGKGGKGTGELMKKMVLSIRGFSSNEFALKIKSFFFVLILCIIIVCLEKERKYFIRQNFRRKYQCNHTFYI